MFGGEKSVELICTDCAYKGIEESFYVRKESEMDMNGGMFTRKHYLCPECKSKNVEKYAEGVAKILQRQLRGGRSE